MIRLLIILEKLLFAVAICALVFMIAHVTLEVILRLLGVVSQLQTITFVSAWYMVAVIFCALPFAERIEGHISVDIVTSMLPHGFRAHLRRAVSAVSAFYLGLLAYLSLMEAWDQTTSNEIWETSTGYISVWPGRWAVALAFTSLSLHYALRFIRPASAEMPQSSPEAI